MIGITDVVEAQLKHLLRLGGKQGKVRDSRRLQVLAGRIGKKDIFVREGTVKHWKADKRGKNGWDKLSW